MPLLRVIEESEATNEGLCSLDLPLRDPLTVGRALPTKGDPADASN